MIANDPHLALGLPSTFYPIHLTAGPYDVAGNAFAGTPGVVLGHNKDVMWGATTNPMDVTDTYAEQVVVDLSSPTRLSTVFQGDREHVLAVPEAYRVNTLGNGVVAVPPNPQIPAQTFIVPRRNNGPIVAFTPPSGSTPGSALSVQYTGFSGTRELDAILAWNRAKDLADFRAGMTLFDFGSQNWSYADKRGNLAYFTSAEMPLREDMQAGTVNGAPPWFIRNGQGGNEWLPATTQQPGQAVPYEILPPEEMPHVVNPDGGFFVNANNDPTGSTFDNNPLNQTRPGGGIFYLNPGYDGFRAARITEMVRAAIGAGEKVSLDDLKAQQADVTLLDAEVLVPHLVEAFDRAGAAGADPALAALAGNPGVSEAVGRLRSWDFTTPTGIAAGYDASDVGGQLSPPTDSEIRASVAATIYAVWRGQVLANTIDGTLRGVGLGSMLPDADQAMASVRHLLDTFGDNQGVGASGLDFFAVDGVAAAVDQRDVVLLRAVDQALGLLASAEFAPAFSGSTNQDDYRWGVLHRKEFRHVLGGPWTAPPAGGLEPAVEGLPGVSTDGGFGTVDASGHSARADGLNEFTFGGGPVRRFVGIAQPGRPYAETSLPGGASGLRGSPHYADLLPMWLTNETYLQLLREPGLRPTITAAMVVRPG
jgi:penicillin amidase